MIFVCNNYDGRGEVCCVVLQLRYFNLTIVMTGVRSARLEQKREKYLRRRQQLSHVETGVSQREGDIVTIRPFDRLDVF